MAVILGSLTALAPLSMDMYLPALPTLVANLHANPTVVQLTLTACLVGMAMGQFVAGPVSDARGRRAPLLTGILVYVLASALCAFTSSIWMLIVLRWIQGFAGAAGIVIARAVARDHYQAHDLTRFFAMLMLVNGAAPILAPIIGGQLLRFTSWRGVFIVLGALGVIMLSAVAFGLQESLPADRRVTGGLRRTVKVIGRLVRDQGFMAYVLAQSLVYAAMFAYIGGSPFVLQNLFGISPQGFSAIFATNSVGIILAGQVAARLSVRIGERKVLMAGLIAAATGSLVLLAMVLVHAPVPAVLVPLFVSVASVGAVGTTCTSLALQSHGQWAGSASAMIGTCQMLLGGLAAPLSGLGGTLTAVPLGLVITVCDVGALAAFLILRHRSES
jgi:DHA1 family bicyclomycin/chloramphenicol resistance-like MFS transporter